MLTSQVWAQLVSVGPVQVQWYFTFTETIRDRELRTATSTFTQFLSSDSPTGLNHSIYRDILGGGGGPIFCSRGAGWSDIYFTQWSTPPYTDITVPLTASSPHTPPYPPLYGTGPPDCNTSTDPATKMVSVDFKHQVYLLQKYGSSKTLYCLHKWLHPPPCPPLYGMGSAGPQNQHRPNYRNGSCGC